VGRPRRRARHRRPGGQGRHRMLARRTRNVTSRRRSARRRSPRWSGLCTVSFWLRPQIRSPHPMHSSAQPSRTHRICA
jgi:hypothetical protein